MAVDQRKLITVLKDAVNDVEDRYLGYRTDLLDYVSQIVMLEREHEKKATQIQKKVIDRIDALGVLIGKSESGAS